MSQKSYKSVFAVQDVLHSLKLEHLWELFEKEDITMDVLVDMTSEALQTIGVSAFGHRHKILKNVKELGSRRVAQVYIGCSMCSS